MYNYYDACMLCLYTGGYVCKKKKKKKIESRKVPHQRKRREKIKQKVKVGIAQKEMKQRKISK